MNDQNKDLKFPTFSLLIIIQGETTFKRTR